MPPARPNFPADDADNADKDPDLLDVICVNLRDLRGSSSSLSTRQNFPGRNDLPFGGIQYPASEGMRCSVDHLLIVMEACVGKTEGRAFGILVRG
jgi:hypothetical protein